MAHAHTDHDHDHHHGGHHHHHHPAPGDHSRAFLIAIILNVGFVAVEFAYGLIAHSTALMADAGHNLSDVLGLALAWGAAVLTKKRPEGRYTYGLRSSSILAALGNSMLLLVACGGIGWEALHRLLVAPEPVGSMTVSVVAGAGIVVNAFSAWLFMAGSKGDLNLRGAYLHMAADAVVSLAVVAGGLAMSYTGWYWVDPLLSLAIVAVILGSSFGLLRDALRLSLNAVPAHIALDEVRAYLVSQPGVAAVHDLHIWGMSTTETALTAHLHIPGGHPDDAFFARVADELEHRFGIKHSTLQVSRHHQLRCALVS
jgi:cobalt-zinc-cadmium efflux system protein